VSSTPDEPAATRQRRADARRSVTAIVQSARRLLSGDTDASVEAIASAAGVSRQTVYAHFPTRDLLVTAAIEVERAEGLAALESAGLEDLSPLDALHRFLDISWEIAERFPLTLDPAIAKAPAHGAVGEHLERIFRRGQLTGHFDGALPATWLTGAAFALGQCAAEEIAAGQLTRPEAVEALLESVLRLAGAQHTGQPGPGT